MTMRMEATPEEPGRRDQTLDAGAETVVALYRLGRVAQMHDPSNQAYSRQIDQTQQAVVDYCSRAGRFFSVLFAPTATFVGGELLRGPRATQEFATELGSLLEARGISEIIITKDVSPEDLLDLSRLLAPGAQAPPFANARIRVRAVEDVARVRGLAIEHLPIDRRIARTYGEAIVSVRRLFDELLAGRYVLQPRIKRIAQSLVELAAAQNPFFVGVTETRPSESDEAVRAVHAAFLSAAMARELGADRRKSVEIVLAALLHDAALPRIRSRAVEQTGRTGEQPEADQELPAGTAATLAAFCGLHEESMPRAVVAFESQWSGFTGPLGAVYHGARPPTLQARIVAVAHQWARIRVASHPKQARSLDDAIAALLDDLHDASDVAVARLLVATLRFYPAGTVLELDTGEIAEVVDGRDVGNGSPLVRITIDAQGRTLDQPIEVDLAAPAQTGTRRNIVGVRSVEGWRRLERSTTPATLPKAATNTTNGDDSRGSLPSISPGMLDGLSNNGEDDFIQVLRTELNDQLSDPREKSTPNLDEAAAKAMAMARRESSSGPAAPPTSTHAHTPSARGSLATTPLVHVLIYLLDHCITGSVELVEPDGVTHVVYVRKGAPVKVKTGRVVAPLAELLANSGKLALDRVPELVATAEHEGILLGESLVARSLISRGQLWAALEVQIPLKLERLANLPPETKYVLYKDKNLLERWGGADAVAADPIHVIHCVVRRWHDRARVRATLARLSKHPLIVRADAKIGGLKLTPEERAVLDAIRGQRATVGVLQHMRLADAEALSSLVYTLAVTRQLDLPSQRKQVGPMGLRSASLPAPPPRHTAPPSSNAQSRPRSSEESLPFIAEAIASALSAPPPASPSASSEVDIPAAAPAAAPVDVAPVAPLTGSIASPLSSTSGIPPVSSSRARIVDSASRRNAGPPSATSTGATRASLTSEALDAADRALEAMGRFRLADTALQKGDVGAAERLAHEAVTLDPEPVEYRAMLVWARAQSSSIEQLPSLVGAMTDFLVEHPDHPRVLLYRARLLAKQGRTREAIADYEAHLRTSPKNKEALAELNALR